MLSSLTIDIQSCLLYPWDPHSKYQDVIQDILWVTRILQNFSERKHLRVVRVQFSVLTSTLGRSLLHDVSSREACTALEESLLAFPAFKFQFCWLVPDWRRAGRAEFWSPTIRSAFPKLNHRGLLQLPQSKYNSDSDLAYNELTVSIVTVPPKRALQIPLATSIMCPV